MSKDLIKGGLHNLCRTPDRQSFQFQSLDLSSVRIDALNVSLAEYTAIRFLDLSNNLLVDLQHLVPLVNLEELRLSGNRVKGIQVFQTAGPEGEGANFSKLRKLWLDENKISDLPAFKLPKLTHLSLNENRIENFAALTGNTSLTILEARSNKIKNLQAFKEMSKLKELYIANNPLSSIAGLEGLSELRTLHVRKCRIAEIEEELPELPNLTKINLRENKIGNIETIKRLFQFGQLSDINVIDNPVSPSDSNILMLEVLILNTKITRFNKIQVEKEDLLEAIYLSEYKWVESEKERIRKKRKEEEEAAKAAEAENAD